MFYFLLRKLFFFENTFTGYVYSECSNENFGFKLERFLVTKALFLAEILIIPQFLLTIRLVYHKITLSAAKSKYPKLSNSHKGKKKGLLILWSKGVISVICMPFHFLLLPEKRRIRITSILSHPKKKEFLMRDSVI